MSSAVSFERPLVASIITACLDNFVLGEKDKYKNAQFALAVGVSVLGADAVSGSIVNAIGVSSSNSAIAVRVSEIVFASGGAYALNKFVLGNSNYSYYNRNDNDFLKRVGCIVIADLASNVVIDILTSKPVSLFS